MSEMIERITSVLRSLPIRDNLARGGELDALRLGEAARAVLEAMREPTPEVWEALASSMYGHPRDKAVEFAKEDKYESDGYRAEDAWKAGIDAALSTTAQPTPAVME